MNSAHLARWAAALLNRRPQAFAPWAPDPVLNQTVLHETVLNETAVQLRQQEARTIAQNRADLVIAEAREVLAALELKA
jgi:hypothetical protein